MELPDFLLDNITQTITFACWIKTSGSGVIIGCQDAQTVQSTPNIFSPMLYIGTDGYVRASVNAVNYWENYHLGRHHHLVQGGERQ